MIEIEEIANKVARFQKGNAADVADGRAKARSLSVNKRDALYRNIQEAYCIASELMLPENSAALDSLLARHNLKRDPRSGTNPWMPVTNMLFGRWTEGKNGPRFEVDKSAKKYASSLRYFHDHAWEPELIASQLNEVPVRKPWGKGLIGTQKAGDHEHRAEDPDELKQTARVQRMLAVATPLATIDRHDLTRRAMEDGELILLWGHCVGREVRVLGELRGKGNGARVLAYLRRAATEAYMFCRKHIIDGRRVGVGCMLPQLVGDNILDGLKRDALASRAGSEVPEPQVSPDRRKRGKTRSTAGLADTPSPVVKTNNDADRTETL